MICQFFNQGSCLHQANHETKGVLYKHVCNHRFTKSGKAFPQTSMNVPICKDKRLNTIPLFNNANASDVVNSFNNNTYKHVSKEESLQFSVDQEKVLYMFSNINIIVRTI